MRRSPGQIESLLAIVDERKRVLVHVKPHGALYTDAARDAVLAKIVVRVVHAIGSGVALMGPPNSELQSAAKNRERQIY